MEKINWSSITKYIQFDTKKRENILHEPFHIQKNISITSNRRLATRFHFVFNKYRFSTVNFIIRLVTVVRCFSAHRVPEQRFMCFISYIKMYYTSSAERFQTLTCHVSHSLVTINCQRYLSDSRNVFVTFVLYFFTQCNSKK